MIDGGPQTHRDGRLLRVLSIIDSLGQGGAERSLIDLAIGLRDHDIDTTLAVLRMRDDGFTQGARESGLQVTSLGPARIAAMARLRRMVSSIEIDVVHTTLFESSVIGRLGVAGMGLPVVTSLVNVSYDPVRLVDPRVSRTKLRLARGIDAWTARHLTSGFHALTHAVAAQSVKDLGIAPTSVVVIPRGRKPDEFYPPASEDERRVIRRGLDIEAGIPVLISVGRHEYQKGHRHLIDAMHQIVETSPGAVLLLAGREGNETQSLIRQVESLRLGGRVKFLGDRRDVAKLLRAADVFVFPSLYEGFGGSLIEAMATGLPIVTSDLAPIREVVGDTAILTRPADPDALSTAVELILGDRAAAEEIGEAGLNRFHENFRLDTVTAAMAQFFHRAAVNAPARHHR